MFADSINPVGNEQTAHWCPGKGKEEGVVDVVTLARSPRFLNLGLSDCQEALLRSFYGMPLVTEAQRDYWRVCAGGRPYLEGHEFGNMTATCGARGGKDSRIAAPIMIREAAFGGHERRVATGETPLVALVAQDAPAAKIAFQYIAGGFLGSPVLAAMLDGEPLATSLRLKNGVEVRCFPCTLKSMRGYSVCAAVLDELAFWRLEGSADSDIEIQTSIRRGMSGFQPHAKLVKISTPYMRSGVLYEDDRRAYGRPDPDLLVWRATSGMMNPVVFTPEALERERRAMNDPGRFAREFEAEYADDVSAFLAQHLIDGAVRGRGPQGWRDGVVYIVVVDPAAGGDDWFTVTVVHLEGDVVVQDFVEGWSTKGAGTIDLEGITGKCAEVAKRYRAKKVYGDRLARAWVAQAFRRHEIQYEADEHVRVGKSEWRYLDKSAGYLESEALWTQGRIEILADERQLRQLAQLEKRPGVGGRYVVDHPKGPKYHDDFANVLCLAAAIASVQAPRKRMLQGYGGTAPATAAPIPGQRWRCRVCQREYTDQSPEGRHISCKGRPRRNR